MKKLQYELKEENGIIAIELTIPEDSKEVKMPFLAGGFSQLTRYSNRVAVELKRTPVTDDHLKQGIIVDGERHELTKQESLEEVIEKPSFEYTRRVPGGEPLYPFQKISKDVPPSPDLYALPEKMFFPRKTERKYKTRTEEKLEKLENFLEKQTYEIQSVGCSHLRRTARGAQIFFTKLTEDEKYQIQFLGLLHQLNPKLIQDLSYKGFPEDDVFTTNAFLEETRLQMKELHEIPNVNAATALKLRNSGYVDLQVLASAKPSEICKDISIDEEEANKIVTSAQRTFEDYRQGIIRCNEIGNQYSQAVFMADKILEESGAYGVGRICYYVGEIAALSNNVPKNLEQLNNMLIENLENSLLNPSHFPWFSQRLINYQEKWKKTFMDVLKKEGDWAIDVGSSLFELGAQGEDFEKSLKKIDSFHDESLPFLLEERKYIEGEKYEDFVDLLSSRF